MAKQPYSSHFPIKWMSKEEKAQRWESRFLELVAYKQNHGHCKVPVLYQANKPLGLWVSKQRGYNNKGKLRVEKGNKLDSIGFDWGRKRKAPPSGALAPPPSLPLVDTKKRARDEEDGGKARMNSKVEEMDCEVKRLREYKKLKEEGFDDDEIVSFIPGMAASVKKKKEDDLAHKMDLLLKYKELKEKGLDDDDIGSFIPDMESFLKNKKSKGGLITI